MGTQSKAIAILLGVFLLGGVSGGALGYAFAVRDEVERMGPDHGRRLRAFAWELGLSPEQRERVEAIRVRHQPRMRRLMRAALDQCGGPVRAHRAEVDAEVRKILTPEQRERFDEILVSRGERGFMGRGRFQRRRHRRRGGGHRGGRRGPPHRGVQGVAGSF